MVRFLKSLTTLQWALGLSALLHAGLLTVRFVDPEGFNRVFEDLPLEVILVNARTDEAPAKAQAIAQANLAGGGDSPRPDVRATSPLPPSLQASLGDAATEESQRQIEAMREQQNHLLTQLRQQIAALPPLDVRQPNADPEARAREERRRHLTQMLAEIERAVQEENARPKKRFISPATREEVYALYYDALRRKIEARGTSNFPEMNGRKLYGELTMMVTVNHDGRVLDTEVVEGSSSRHLDRRAEAIAQAAGPFEKFSAAMRRRADQIVIVSRFRFTRDETLQTQLLGN
ncbi:MAG: TonB family protein [Comamonadaceae bacterium]|nr:TonB family protein [Comamonadaceae bacterium]RRD58114.1 TonB family protein [Comamonadaceae bacterium OH2545_COT-014]